jgi:hypothetical protein
MEAICEILESGAAQETMEDGFELAAVRARGVRLWEETNSMTNRYGVAYDFQVYIS